jgi:UDP-N-acetylglucosamine:LPS N-acetylglucosamine transferase
MRVVITGGGTAVAAALRARGVADLHWIGSRAGVDARRVPEAGIAFYPVDAGKLRRYWDWRNVSDVAFRVPLGLVQSWRLLRRLEPSLVFATGGFVSLRWRPRWPRAPSAFRWSCTNRPACPASPTASRVASRAASR